MPLPDWENLDDFLNPAEFAVRAVIQCQSGRAVPVIGIYDDPYFGAQMGEFELDTVRPTFTCASLDVAVVTRGDTITIEGRVMDIVAGPRSDGTGLAVLELAPQPE